MPSGVFYMFHLGPVPVFGSVWFMLLLLFLSQGSGDLAGGVLFGICVAVSVLVHELGHAVLALRYRLSPQIVLTGFGGATHHETPANARQAALVTAAGPAAGILLGVVSIASLLVIGVAAPELLEAKPRLGTFLTQLVGINFIWSIFNLLPLFPMDGGQLLRLGLLRFMQRPATAEQVTHVVGVAVAGGLIVLAIAVRMPFMALIALLLGVDNARRIRATSASGPIYARQHPAEELFGEAEAALATEDFREVARLGHHVRSLSSLPDELADRASELIAIGSIRSGRVEEGLRYARRAPMTPRLLEACIEGHLAVGDVGAAEALVDSDAFRALPADVREPIEASLRQRGA